MDDQETELPPPHVLIFPYPAQGHVNPMLKLAELLCHAGLHVTFLVTHFTHRRLLRNSTALISRLTCYSGFQFEAIPDGLPEDDLRSGDRVMELFRSFRVTAKPLLRELLESDGGKDSGLGRKRASCIIADGILSFAIDVGEEVGIPVIIFRTTSACAFWAFFCGPKLIEAGEIPSFSVIYVSFGSITMMTKDQLMEFWHGLVNSGKRFLWVIRPNSVMDEDWENHLSIEILEATKKQGFIVGWTPQDEVLGHESIGGFLTHSGWNSTLKSIAAGVPMICWPYFGDQQINSRFVGEVWKLELDMKDTCDLVIIKMMIRDLMDVRREEFQHSSNQMAKLAKKSYF